VKVANPLYSLLGASYGQHPLLRIQDRSILKHDVGNLCWHYSIYWIRRPIRKRVRFWFRYFTSKLTTP